MAGSSSRLRVRQDAADLGPKEANAGNGGGAAPYGSHHHPSCVKSIAAAHENAWSLQYLARSHLRITRYSQVDGL